MPPKAPLVAPILLPSSTLQFAAVKPEGTAQDVIDVLLKNPEVKEEILGDLVSEAGCWALQRVVKNDPSKAWEEEELQVLRDDLELLDMMTPVAPFLKSAAPSTPSLHRHFSAFPLTSHLHTPTLRLVVTHPALKLQLGFLRVPEISDDFVLDWYISRNTAAGDIVHGVSELLGLSKSLGGANVPYVLEEVVAMKTGKECKTSAVSSKLPLLTQLLKAITSLASNASISPRLTQRPSHTFRLVVPDDWYRRSKSRSISSSLSLADDYSSSQDIPEDDDEEEGGGTAKAVNLATLGTPTNSGPGSPQSPSKASQGRLSSIFDSWRGSIRPPTSLPLEPTNSRLSVSDPVPLMAAVTGVAITFGKEESNEDDVEAADFERMMDELGLKGPQREQMNALPSDRKQYLVKQNKLAKSASSTTINQSPPRHASENASYGSASASLLPQLVPQLTGGVMKRFSLAGLGWGATDLAEGQEDTGGAIGGPTFPLPTAVNSAQKSSRLPPNDDSSAKSIEDSGNTQPLVPQSTGGLWNNWWSAPAGPSASGAGSADRTKPQSCAWYVDNLKPGVLTGSKLAKHLISLRVHLSTAKLTWIEKFVKEERGMDLLGGVLDGLVGTDKKRRKLGEIDDTVLGEVVKCFRVLLNTEPGFERLLASPVIVTHITFALSSTSAKFRTLAAELLAAVCVLSLTADGVGGGLGHKLVLAAFSDYRVAFGESFRFQELVEGLKLPEHGLDATYNSDTSLAEESNDEGSWDARTASMALVNAITNCPEVLEDRIMLREELSRRGLNEAIVALRYLRPPDRLQTQIDVYTEDKFEDEEDMRERTRATMQNITTLGEQDSEPELHASVGQLFQTAKEHGEVYAALLDITCSYCQILERETSQQFKVDLFAVLSKFSTHAVLLDDFWKLFIERFGESIQMTIGPRNALSLSGDHASADDELNRLRMLVEQLEDERKHLRNSLSDQQAETNTFRALQTTPTNGAKRAVKPGHESTQNFHGLVQRLVQKEKQVLQLQAEVDRFKSENPSEGREAEDRAKRDRERNKLNNLNEEIARLKTKVGELETALGIKDKEAVYLKRALESVYSRFHTSFETDSSGSRDSGVDAQQIAAQAIESMTQKEAEIKGLKAEVEGLTAQVAGLIKITTHVDEKAFKARVPPPPPPPPPQPRADHSDEHSVSLPPEIPPAPAPPPPPPPPPPARSNSIQSSALPETSSPIPPPPPPPPPLSVLSHPLLKASASSMPHPAFGSIPLPPPPPPPPTLGSGAVSPPPPPPPITPLNNPTPASHKPLKIVQPVKRLKVDSSVWSEIKTKGIQLDLKDLEATFSLAQGTLITSPIIASNAKKQGPSTLLDITRAQNIGKLARKLLLQKLAILRVDDQQLSLDELKAISKHVPTVDEINRLKDFADVGKLARADQYFCEIMTVPRLAERLECMMFRRRLEVDVAEARPELDTLRDAAKELRASSRFKTVLQTVLVVGNALNGSTFRGGARGFQLDALLKLKETKTANSDPSCPTLLHYVARVLLRSDPSSVLFVEDLPHVEPAARLSIQAVIASANAIFTSMEQAKSEIQAAKKAKGADDRFAVVMEPFVNQSQASVDALKDSAMALDKELKSVLIYYGETGEPGEGMKPEELFGILMSFASALQASRKAAAEVRVLQGTSQPSGSSLQVKESAVEAPRILEPDTVKQQPSEQSLLQAPGIAASINGRRSIGRGDFDAAIRSIRQGGRPRARATRPLSKMFLDGSGIAGRPITTAHDN
ncbi:hypothetical protein FRB97_000969 [Tulasnella sp. 331]|nr:hypothetical protein FRB97_000969 [Tulasnella sp. 331]